MRAMLIGAWFALIIVPHLLFAAAGRRDVIAPRFLAGTGWLAGLRLRRRGQPAEGRLLLLSNHVSWLDILALAASARAAFVAHAGLAGHPVLRWLCEQNDTIFITRTRRGSVQAQIAQVQKALEKRHLVIFPEGTTGDGRHLLPFKSSLLSAAEFTDSDRAELAIQPVALDYSRDLSIAWVGEEHGLHNMLRILGRVRPVHCTLHFLNPLAGEARAGRKPMAQAAEAAIADALRVQIRAPIG